MLFDPKNCRCVESDAHKRFRERLASIEPTDERLLEAIFGEPEPEFTPQDELPDNPKSF